MYASVQKKSRQSFLNIYVPSARINHNESPQAVWESTGPNSWEKTYQNSSKNSKLICRVYERKFLLIKV